MTTLSAKPNRFLASRVKLWFQRLHLWSALIVGIVLVITTTSGSLALFHTELDSLFYPMLHTYTASDTPISIDAALATVRAAYPDYTVTSVNIPHRRAYTVDMTSPEDESYIAYLDPGTGKLNGIQNSERTIMSWVATLHTSLQLGGVTFPWPENTPTWLSEKLIGENLSDPLLKITSLAFFLMVLTGMVIWWPSVKKLGNIFKLRLNKSDFLKHYDWHKILGLVALPFLIMWAVTAINFYEPYNPVVKSIWHAITFSKPIPDYPEKEPTSTVVEGAAIISAAKAQVIAKTVLPNAKLVYYAQPEEDTGTVDLWLAQGYDPFTYGPYPGNADIKLDAYSGKVLFNNFAEPISWGGSLYANWFYPLHAATAVPWWARLLWFVTGMVPLFLAVTGTSMWWIKHKGRIAKKRTNLVAVGAD
jgi:uncharacterized iron-regulated membrane protein